MPARQSKAAAKRAKTGARQCGPSRGANALERCTRPRRSAGGTRSLKIALAQINLLVGDVRGNLERVIAEARRARDELRADLVLFPELTLSGYPPEDLLFHRGLRLQIERALDELTAARCPRSASWSAIPSTPTGISITAALLMRGGRVLAQHRKACLPNYNVFDEKRYFTPGTEATVVDFDGFRLGPADLRGRLGAAAGGAAEALGRRGAADHQRLAL